ncbi:MAG TPA: hypothetical protein VFM01_13610, partial [Nakamurella sp.]|nr:hypothetical protein [Nakamurella sp.]
FIFDQGCPRRTADPAVAPWRGRAVWAHRQEGAADMGALMRLVNRIVAFLARRRVDRDEGRR